MSRRASFCLRATAILVLAASACGTNRPTVAPQGRAFVRAARSWAIRNNADANARLVLSALRVRGFRITQEDVLVSPPRGCAEDWVVDVGGVGVVDRGRSLVVVNSTFPPKSGATWQDQAVDVAALIRSLSQRGCGRSWLFLDASRPAPAPLRRISPTVRTGLQLGDVPLGVTVVSVEALDSPVRDASTEGLFATTLARHIVDAGLTTEAIRRTRVGLLRLSRGRQTLRIVPWPRMAPVTLEFGVHLPTRRGRPTMAPLPAILRGRAGLPKETAGRVAAALRAEQGHAQYFTCARRWDDAGTAMGASARGRAARRRAWQWWRHNRQICDRRQARVAAQMAATEDRAVLDWHRSLGPYAASAQELAHWAAKLEATYAPWTGVVIERDPRADCVGIPAWRWSDAAGVAFMPTEVTAGQYWACVDSGACTAPRLGPRERPLDLDRPMSRVTGRQAARYCRWVGGRLPTQDEWLAEATDRGQRAYPWGNELPTCERAVFNSRFERSSTLHPRPPGGPGCGTGGPVGVCSRPDGNSVSGLCDMLGNASEMTKEPGALHPRLRGLTAWDRPRPLRKSDPAWPTAPGLGMGLRCVREGTPVDPRQS